MVMERMSQDALVIFAGDPIIGQVKTRLSEDIGEMGALALYRVFLNNILAESNLFSGDLFVATTEAKTDYFSGYHTFLQKGRDLGERMFNAFREMFDKGYNRVIIVGSNIPELTVEPIELSVLLLKENNVVIGPSQGGGYYLIGISKGGLLADMFKGIAWGSDTVLDDIIANMARLNLTYKLLEKRNNIYTLDDLIEFSNKGDEKELDMSKFLKQLEGDDEE